MLLLIEKVEVGAEYEGVIYNYWIYAQQIDGKPIRIFDYSRLNLSDNVTDYVECQLFANLSTPGQGAVTIKGIYVGRKELSCWKRVVEERVGNKYSAIETSAGVILFSELEAKGEYEVGESIELHVIRFDLVAINN